MFETIVNYVKDWFLKPVEKKGLRAVLFGQETLLVCIILLVGGIVLGLSLFIMQMCSVAIDTREGIVGFGCTAMILTCIWLLVPAVKALNAIWKKIIYVLMMPILFSIVLSISQWLIFIVIGGLICGVLFKGFFGGYGGSVPTSIAGGNTSPEDNSSNYGKFYSGISGDYIQGEHGDDQRITMDLGGGNVETEKGNRYHIDESGHATKI